MTSDVTFSVRIKGSAAKELGRIPNPMRGRIALAIDALAEQPFRGSVLKGESRGLRRVRVGDYRIVYEVLHEVLVVLVIRSRTDRTRTGNAETVFRLLS